MSRDDAASLPPKALELVRRFERQRESYKSGQYNETQLRREFVDPFFKTLGWDVDNEQGHAEAYKDVIHEDAVRVGGAIKAPDYCFRIGGARKFFVETKKPSVNVKGDPAPAFQLRRYGWSAKLPLSILTDFEEFAVYDCRVRPAKTDRSSTARVLYMTFDDYPSRWDEIAGVFSRDAVLKGSFDKFAESRKRRGTAEVDAAFLKEIEGWRDALARNIALRNSRLSQRDLNFAVQRTIDRIIFLRICEDRGVEDYARLLALLNTEAVYKRLVELFHRADDRYNSGLFHFRGEKDRREAPDELTPTLTIDDVVLKDVIRGLYYPDSPYEFSVLPADILGAVYEQFLGKVIRLTPGHRAKVEDKPEVKKAGGVYYTPTYIVDYIVKHTVGELLKDRTPKQAAALRIIDPACGSGSFLIGAYQRLLDWHLDWYTNDDPKKWAKRSLPLSSRRSAKHPAIYQTTGNGWRLTVAERKRILINNIYGVDIDPQAVEVTKLSLLLKVLEGETAHTLGAHLWYEKERALPDLASNIKCGNSLIGPDFYDNMQMDMFDEEERYRINVFDWDDEFPEIMKNGGFDAVIGNPPYVFGEYHDKNTKPYLSTKYSVANRQYDTYWLFIERGLALMRRSGYFSLIVPDALLARDECAVVRAKLLPGLESVYHCGFVFSAAVSAVVFVTAKDCISTQVRAEVRSGTQPQVLHDCSRQRFEDDHAKRFLIHASDQEAHLFARIVEYATPLCKTVQISRGEEIGKKHVSETGRVPILVGEDISRYAIVRPTRFVNIVKKRADVYAAPKIVAVKTGASCIASLDEVGIVTMQSVYNIHVTMCEVDPRLVLALLNSRFLAYYVHKTFTAYKLLFPQLNQTTIEQLPVPKYVLHGAGLHLCGSLVSLVQRMLDLYKRLPEAKTAHAKTVIQRQIDATDDQIDRLVYDLYELTDEEIAIVEEASGKG